MARVTVYSTGRCAYCDRAKDMLTRWGIPYEEVRVDLDHAAKLEFRKVTNHARSVPQIIIDGKLIGGFSELTELHMDGELDDLMEPEQ
jgi:glutaredoxin 3